MMKESAKKELSQFLADNDTSSINNICSPLYQLGLTGFYYIKMYSDGSFADLTSDLNWAEFYFRKFFTGEYSVQDMQYNTLPEGINLWELNKENQIWKDGRDYFNVGNGFSMAMPNTAFTEMFFYYSDASNYKINHLYLNNLDIFKNFSVYFKERAEKLIKKAENYKITIPDCYRPVLLNNNAHSQNRQDAISQYYAQLDTKKFYISASSHYLTYREAECLFWYAKSKTIKEIGWLLGLSNKTIATHLDHIKLKLNCPSKAQLTNLAIQYGIIDFFQQKLCDLF